MPAKVLTSKQISAKFGLPYSTVTHYTNLGLFSLAGRKGNRRLYCEDDVAAKLKLITKLTNEGYPLRLIRDKFILKAVVVLIAAFLCLQGSVFAEDMPAAAPVGKLTLHGAIETALQHNPNVQSMLRAVESSQYMHLAASKEWLPTLSMDYIFTVLPKNIMITDSSDNSEFPLTSFTSYIWAANIKMPIYTGGALQHKEAIEKLGIDVSRMRYLEARADLIQEVTINYFNVLRHKHYLEAAKESLKDFLEHERLTAEYFDTGKVPKNSLLEVKVKRTGAGQGFLSAEKDLAASEAILNVSMGVDIDSRWELEGSVEYSDPKYDLRDCLALAQLQNPTLVAYTYMKLRAKEAVELEKAASRPKLFADFSFFEHGKTPALKGDDYISNDIMMGMVVAQWNVFDWFKTRDRADARKKELEGLIDDQKAATDKVCLDIRTSYLDLEVARESFGLVKQKKIYADENYRIAKLRYDEEVARSTEVNDALVLLKQADFDYYDALLNIIPRWRGWNA